MAPDHRPGSGEPKVSVERLAELHTSIGRGEEVAGLLRALGITEQEWRTSVAHHLTALGAEIRSGGRELCDRYLQAARDDSRSAQQTVSPEPAAPTAYFEAECTTGPASLGPATLPFRKGTQWLPSPSPNSSEATAGSGETLAINPDALAQTELPFESAVLDLLKLHRYVEMAAALRSAPGQANAIMASFGLQSPEQCERLHHLWHLRFRANPILRARFLSQVEALCEAVPSNMTNERKDEP